MRSYVFTPLIAVLAFANPAWASDQPMKGRPAHSVTCDPRSPGSLKVLPHAESKAPRYSIVAPSTVNFVGGIEVEGPCAKDIAAFNTGQATLVSGHRFVFQRDGRIRLYPPVLPDHGKLSNLQVGGLVGYVLKMAESVSIRATSSGKRESYLGLFRGKSDYLIARFDVLNGVASEGAEVLIRSNSPIESIDFLPAPDTPDGRIGIVQRTNTSRVWLYSFDWHHGDLQPLPG